MLEELESVIAASYPASDYAPRPGSTGRRIYLNAGVAGAASLIDPWPALFDRPWTSAPWRDRFAIAHDFWRSTYRFAAEHNLPLNVHPDQVSLFAPDAFHER